MALAFASAPKSKRVDGENYTTEAHF